MSVIIEKISERMIVLKEITVDALFSPGDTLAAPLLKSVKYAFEVLPKLAGYIKEIGPKLDPAIYDCKGDDIWIAKSATVAPTAYIKGPCIVGENSEVRHCAFLRGSVLIGNNCVAGNSSELKNVILVDTVQVPHYNYVGDSVLGTRAHMGAGAITSNVKSDRTLVVIRTENEVLETGLKKVGAMIGDGVEIGCGSVLNPGTVIGKNTIVYPLSSVRGVIPANSIYKKQGEVVERR